MKLALAALLAFGSSRTVSSRPEFPLKLTRIDGDVDDVLLQVYDPERKRWVGWGLFRLERDEEGLALGGKTVFCAPREGEWKLRAVARSRSGRREKEPKAAFEATAVYDATPPRGAVWCDGGAVVWASSEDGRARVEAAEGGVWVELGRDLPATGSTGSLSAPLRPGQRVRVTITDEAGNSTVIEAVSAHRTAPFGPEPAEGSSPKSTRQPASRNGDSPAR